MNKLNTVFGFLDMIRPHKKSVAVSYSHFMQHYDIIHELKLNFEGGKSYILTGARH